MKMKALPLFANLCPRNPYQCIEHYDFHAFLRLRSYGNGYSWNSNVLGMDKLCVSTGRLGKVPFGIVNWFQMGLLSN